MVTSQKTCLRCDWGGETEEARCPSCDVPLYVVATASSVRAEAPAPPTTSGNAQGSEAVLADDPPERRSTGSEPSPPRGDASGPSHPSRRIGAIVAITLALVFVTGWWLIPREGPRPVSTASPDAAASDSNVIDGERSPVVEARVYVLDLDTEGATLLPDAISDRLAERPSEPGVRYAASPDGSTLAFIAADDEGRFQVFVADLDGTGIRQVTSDPVGASTPAWSPDGTTIAYKGYTGQGAAGLFVLDVATGEARKVIDVATGWTEPTFTPDGSSLLYSSGGDVLTVPVAGGRSTVLFGHGRGGMGYAGNASMSPDGSLVTMMGNEPKGPGALRFVANADGTDLRAIGGRAGSSNPTGTWSPDGTRIVCTRWDGARILVVDVATGDVTEVADGSSAIWLDDHTLLVEA